MHKNPLTPVILVGPRSSQQLTYGMSIGFDLLITGFEDRKLPFYVVDRSQGMIGRRVGAFSWGGAGATINMLLAYLTKLPSSGTVYLTIGTSRSGFLRDMLMIWSAWLLRRRIVLHLKGGGISDFYAESPEWFKLILRKTFAKADTIVVLGKLLRSQFDFVPDIDRKLKIVPNGLPTEIQVQTTAPKSLEGAPIIYVLYLSNMIPSKGYLDVLEACRILHVERNIPIHFNFCGAFLETVNEATDEQNIQGNTAEKFDLLRQSKGVAEVSFYHGTVRGSQKQELLQQAHVFVLPTTYQWEGQPISIIEALAFGTPVITTNYRGIPEQVIDQHNGFLVKPKSPTAIADAVEQLWRNPRQYQQMSSNAIAHYKANFTQEAHLNRLIPTILEV